MTIIENLRLAHAVISAVPEAAFDLTRYKSDCGTIACTAGHLSEHPHFAPFMRLDLYLDRVDDHSVSRYALKMKDEQDLDSNFGPNAYDAIFAQRNESWRDRQHPDSVFDQDDYEWSVHPRVSDKEIALWRIERQIEEVTNKETS
jgi:hypothetical protein